MNWEAFFTLHSDLPREGPGSAEDVAWACACAQVAQNARILDAGCGPGADISTLLQHAPNGTLHAVDTHPPFVAAAKARHPNEPRLKAEVVGMQDLSGPFDLIWSAGALYFLGVAQGLHMMKNKLSPGGALAFSHLVYLVEQPEEPVRAALSTEPGVMTVPELNAVIEGQDFAILGQRVLPQASWDNYYGPMRARIAALRSEADADLQAVLDEGEAEIDLHDQFSDQFGYVLSVLRPT